MKTGCAVKEIYPSGVDSGADSCCTAENQHCCPAGCISLRHSMFFRGRTEQFAPY